MRKFIMVIHYRVIIIKARFDGDNNCRLNTFHDLDVRD